MATASQHDAHLKRPEVDAMIEAVRAGVRVEPHGSRTHAAIGFPVSDPTIVRAPSGVVRHDPADLTVTVFAGTPVAELDAVLDEHGQFVPLDPVDRLATVGGTIAAGLSGIRRLGYGPLRDHVLEVRYVAADGELVKAGGPTVKNVTGYDLVRLLVGSLGTLGLFVTVTLRCRPTPAVRTWWQVGVDGVTALERAFRAVAIVSNRDSTTVGFEGEVADAVALRSRLDVVDEVAAPRLPTRAHRGRISVAPRDIGSVTAALDTELAQRVAWSAEWGVGTVHLGADTGKDLEVARAVAARHGGWMLREAGASDIDPFGVERPHADLQQRVKVAFDPLDRLSPGRFGGLA